MSHSLSGFAMPKNCLWHSHKSSSSPSGVSHVASSERFKCTVP